MLGAELFRQNVLALTQNWPVTRKPRSVVFEDTDSCVVPSIQHIERTCVKPATSEAYVSSGLDCAIRLFNIVEVYGDVGDSVLEWGVGSGRISQHMPDMLRESFCGVDVDAVNIDWCKNNIGWGNYSKIEYNGSLPFPDRTFSFSYGWSVMTHLSERDQIHWIKELGRVTDGVFVLSVHGFSHASEKCGWLVESPEFETWMQNGLRDAGEENLDIHGQVPDGYYRDVAHCPKYIKEKWSEFVDVIDIIPGGFGGGHDAVVCRTKK